MRRKSFTPTIQRLSQTVVNGDTGQGAVPFDGREAYKGDTAKFKLERIRSTGVLTSLSWHIK